MVLDVLSDQHDDIVYVACPRYMMGRATYWIGQRVHRFYRTRNCSREEAIAITRRIRARNSVTMCGHRLKHVSQRHRKGMDPILAHIDPMALFR